MDSALPKLNVIRQARISATEKKIRGWVRRTPVVRLDKVQLGLPPGELVLKLEHLQHTGSFKARGAFANLLLREVPAAGVVAASGGNHGAAVAYAAQELDLPVRIFVPTVSSPAKIDRIHQYGADLVVTGATYAEAEAEAQDWAARSGAMLVHAFDQVETILGAGTVGLELQEQADDVQTLLVSVGGGGLLAGIAASYTEDIRLIGVEPEAAPTLTMALAAGRPVDAPTGSIAVDSLAPRRIGEQNFAVISAYVQETILVSDQEIRAAQWLLWHHLRLVAEPGGCAALAALISGRVETPEYEVTGVVISGANTSVTFV